MFKRRLAAVLFSLLMLFLFRVNMLSAGSIDFRDGIEIRDGNIYINGRRFFINAVGYAPWRPGQVPGKDTVDVSLIENDFKRIEEGGFNSIRTWDALDPAELALAKKYNLKVVQGIWLDPLHDPSDPIFIRDSIEYIKKVAEWSRPYDNVLMYLVMTEPRQEAVLSAGADKTVRFFDIIKSTIRSIDNKPVSMDSWITIGFLDHSMWDVVTFNAFMFVPESINKSIGFREYVRWLKNTHARNKPLFIGETGGFSVSSKKLNDIGFGGNSEAGQAEGDIECVRGSIEAGAAGVCTVSWADTWHYPSDPFTHDDHPWEWDGIIGFRDDKDLTGTPRKVYYEMQKFNKQVLPGIAYSGDAKKGASSGNSISILPLKKGYKISDKIGVRVVATDNKGKPMSGKEVIVGFFLPVSWTEEILRGVTDAKGVYEAECALAPEDTAQYLIVSAGVAAEDAKAPKGSAIVFIELEPAKQ